MPDLDWPAGTTLSSSQKQIFFTLSLADSFIPWSNVSVRSPYNAPDPRVGEGGEGSRPAQEADNLKHQCLAKTRVNSSVRSKLGGTRDQRLVFPDFQSQPWKGPAPGAVHGLRARAFTLLRGGWLSMRVAVRGLQVYHINGA